MSDMDAPDFRYFAQDATVPWSAIGEHYDADDVSAFVEFLIQDGGDPAYRSAADRVASAIRELFAHGAPPPKLSLGDNVTQVERRLAELLGARACVMLTNGTAGIELGYRYANLAPGDEVIAPSNTFIATISYPLAIGARVVFADVDPRTLNMDPADVARKITSRTKVIIPVHLGGWPVDMDPIMGLAAKHDLLVVEDAVQALGASYRGRMAGSIGHFGVFGFHESENITAFGEGGLLAINTPIGADARKARFLGLDLGKRVESWLYDVVALEGRFGPVVGHNSSITEIQALGLLRQLDRLEAIIRQRRENASYLGLRFAENDAIVPQLLDTDEIKSNYHLYLLQIDPERAGGDIQTLKAKLDSRGVTNVAHFAPLYKFELLQRLGYDAAAEASACPVMEEAFARRFTHLPIHPLSRDELETLADAVLESVSEMQRGV